MPQVIREADFDFLVDFHAWIKSGRVASDYGMPPSTITARCDRYGLKAKRGTGLVDKRSDETLEELFDRGAYEFPAAETTQEAAVA